MVIVVNLIRINNTSVGALIIVVLSVIPIIIFIAISNNLAGTYVDSDSLDPPRATLCPVTHLRAYSKSKSDIEIHIV